MTRTWLPLLLLGLVVAVPARSAEPIEKEEPPKEEAPKEESRESRDKSSAKDKHAAELAERYGVMEEEVLALRQDGLGWGEVKHALAISKASGKPVSEIMALRKDGMGWGQISKKYGFKLGEVSRREVGRKDGERRDFRDAPRGLGHGKSRERHSGGQRGRGRK